MFVVNRRIKVALIGKKFDGILDIGFANPLALKPSYHTADGQASAVIVVSVVSGEELDDLRK